MIEDEADTLRNLVLMLQMEGFKALSAPNGRAGVAVARSELPDVILCDVSMPEMDGYGVLQTLRADSATVSIPFIFLTAKGDKRDLRIGMNLGADDYLTKPAGILGCAENTVKVHLARTFERLGVENRNAVSMQAADLLIRSKSGGGTS